MQAGLPKVMGAATLALLLLLSFGIAPQLVAAAGPHPPPAPLYGLTPLPVWSYLGGPPEGNYPGGNEVFTALVVNSDQPPYGNVTILNMTVTASDLPAGQNSNYGIGLPVLLVPGDLFNAPIALQIPSDFSQANFTANLVVNVLLENGTTQVPMQLTSHTVVYMLGPPGESGSHTEGSTTTVTSVSTSTSSNNTALYGVAAVAVIFIIVSGYLAMRGRKPAS